MFHAFYGAVFDAGSIEKYSKTAILSALTDDHQYFQGSTLDPNRSFYFVMGFQSFTFVSFLYCCFSIGFLGGLAWNVINYFWDIP